MKILILEDELPAYEKLRSYIRAEVKDAHIVGWARSNFEAKELLRIHGEPDLIFSDIELLDGLSFDFYNEADITCPIIFCTAFDQYLFNAFQANGISYLLKPYDKENFKLAIDKYFKLFSNNSATSISHDLISNLKEALIQKTNHYKQRFSVKKKDGIKLLSVQNIALIEASGDFSILYDDQGFKNVCNSTLGDIEKMLDPTLFFRINRSEMIQVSFIEKIEAHFKNKLLITLKGMKKQAMTSASKTPLFRKWIDM